MKRMNVETLKEWRDSGKEHQLIDVRENHEYEAANLGGELIPLGEVPRRMNEVNKDVPVVMQCRSGGRSAVAAELIERQYPGIEIYNLEGGILDWKKKFDPSLDVS